MQAIVIEEFGGPEQLQLKEVPTPEPGPGEVRIKTAAVGVNRADVLQRMGYYPPPAGESELLGLEISGVIEKLGPDVTEWQIGDEVLALLAGGGYAEYVVVSAGQVCRPPKGVNLQFAAGLIEVAATVLSNMDHVHLTEGETLLVHGGAGGVGHFAIQYAKALGCKVIATCSAGKMEHVRELGADVVIDYRTDWPAAVKAATEGRGVDVILDIIGAKYLGDNVKSLAMDGRLVIIGMQKGNKGELPIGVLLNKRGIVTATSLRFRDKADKARIVAEVAKRCWPMIETAQIKLAPTIFIPLADAKQAHELINSGDLIGKIVLTV